MFNNITLQKSLIFSFVYMVLGLFFISLVSWISNSDLYAQVDTLGNNSLPSVTGLYKVYDGQTKIDAAEQSLLNPKLTSEDRKAELGKIKQAWTEIETGFKLYETTPRSDEEDRVYKQLQIDWLNWKQNHEQFLNLNQEFERLGIINPDELQLSLLRQGKENSSEIAAAKAASEALNRLYTQSKDNRATYIVAAKLILEDIKINEDAGEQAKKDASKVNTQSKIIVITAMIIGIGSAIGFGFYFIKQVTEPLANQIQSSGIKITTSTTEIAASGKELEATMTEQVASTNEVVATAREIAATAKKLVQTMEEVTMMSQTTAQSASNGQKNLVQMETSMRHLADATASIASRLEIISEKADNINTIVSTITKVADQTNLLSLNAAIEAEQAGEYGMGFAVVAREIRRLADQTAVATLDIESMVKEMQSAVSSGVMEMNKFTTEVSRNVQEVRNISVQLSNVIEEVQSLTPRFRNVNEGMDAQSEGASQISEAMLQLSEASGQTADAIREINRALEELTDAAQNLRRSTLALK